MHPIDRRAERFPVPDPHRLMVADNLDEAAYLVGTAICPHRLRVNEPPRKSLAFLSSLDLGACGLTSLKYGFDVDIDAGSIEDSYLVKWTLAGEGRLQCGDRTAITSSRSIVITDPGEPTKIRMTAECQHLTVRVSRGALLDTLAAKLRRTPRKALRFDLEYPVESDFARAWCELSRCEAGELGVAKVEGHLKQWAARRVEIRLQQLGQPFDQPVEGHRRAGLGAAHDSAHRIQRGLEGAVTVQLASQHQVVEEAADGLIHAGRVTSGGGRPDGQIPVPGALRERDGEGGQQRAERGGAAAAAEAE